MQIKGKRVLITGAGSGMGLATAQCLHEQGAELILLDVNVKPLFEWQRFAQLIEADICDVASIEKAFKTLDPVDVGVFCAGVIGAGRIVGKQGPYPLEDFKRTIDVNLIGHFNVFRLLAAHMAASDSPDARVLIQTASIAAFDGQIGQVAYSASKGAIVSMTLPAARELSRFGIRVMTIAPGLIDTPMLASLKDEARAALHDLTPYPKRFGAPSEYAKLVAHIIENDMLNGEVIRLDGALRMPA